MRSTFGLQLRDDAIEELASPGRGPPPVGRRSGRSRVPLEDSAINETELAAYAEEDFRPARWLRFVLGARFDRIDVAVNNESPTAVDSSPPGYQGAEQFSRQSDGHRVAAEASGKPLRQLRARLSFERRAHADRGGRDDVDRRRHRLRARNGRTPLQGSLPICRGILARPSSEPHVLDGDTASTTPSGSTRRYGGELTGRYNFDDHVFADAAFVATHARYTDAADIALGTTYVTLGAALGPSAQDKAPGEPRLADFACRSRSVAREDPWPIRPATRNRRSFRERRAHLATATSFTTIDAEAGLRWKRLELRLDGS